MIILKQAEAYLQMFLLYFWNNTGITESFGYSYLRAPFFIFLTDSKQVSDSGPLLLLVGVKY